ncbi:MAG TPA: guanitoxin biosynthesis heme-dependent pre-guanitoxin N-hydroxylase GntA [Cyclobacteriaceae bacterium]|nr:guanitoxin biosynthesis heme-dependent pre-guanitoxin N-hydroxylase GntA [Cyclobacteriaceae bacterium]
MGIPEEYFAFIADKGFPCIAAKAALSREQIQVLVCDHIACPKDDSAIIDFLYDFTDHYRQATKLYNSAVVIFKGPSLCSEEQFDQLMWQRLQSISDRDALQHPWDKRVSSDPSHPDFSFSIKAEAFYVIGLHPGSSRKARRFQYPALVFNPLSQFEKLREDGRYAVMKESVRKRDKEYSGSVNPMLADFGESSEAFQYSGRVYNKEWKCPFVSHHETDQHHSTT